jgi:hypothetical protein
MQPIETITAVSDDVFKALAIWEDNVRAQLQCDPDENWILVSMQIIPSMRPVTSLSGLIGPQVPQMEVAVIVVGAFQLKNNILNDPQYQKMMIGTQKVLDKAMEKQKLEQQDNCDHEFGEDGKCVHCSMDVKSL